MVTRDGRTSYCSQRVCTAAQSTVHDPEAIHEQPRSLVANAARPRLIGDIDVLKTPIATLSASRTYVLALLVDLQTAAI